MVVLSVPFGPCQGQERLFQVVLAHRGNPMWTALPR